MSPYCKVHWEILWIPWGCTGPFQGDVLWSGVHWRRELQSGRHSDWTQRQCAGTWPQFAGECRLRFSFAVFLPRRF
jgi:hypothetical protein